MKQLSDCCKAEIILTGKERPEAFACIKCDRIIGTPVCRTRKEKLKEFEELFTIDTNGGIQLVGGSSEEAETDYFILEQFISKTYDQVRAETLKEVEELLPNEIEHKDDETDTLKSAITERNAVLFDIKRVLNQLNK